jgi:hypothetical protein|tara:strand:+ start:910 stop:1239 length:330 start_codon:yes stop_codon:yes gene_type:complete
MRNPYIDTRAWVVMSQSREEMLAAWENSRKKPRETEMPQRFYEVRKRPSPRRAHSVGGITPMGEAVMARDLGLDTKAAKPLDEPEIKYSWVPDGEPGSYEGRRYPQPED